MDMPRNPFKQALAEGRPQIGLWSALCNNISAEIIAGCGFDWIVLDSEHAANEIPGLLSQLQAMAGGTATPVVRPAWNDAVVVKRILDIGARSVLFPYVESAEEARRAVASTRYPPAGIRGVASSPRASNFGRIKDYHVNANAGICVLVQVETEIGLGNLEAIARVEGVDGVFFGPSDIAATHGHLGNPGHPKVHRVISAAHQRLKATGKPGGILAPNLDDAKRWLAEGVMFVAVGSDAALLARGGEALVKAFKS